MPSQTPAARLPRHFVSGSRMRQLCLLLAPGLMLAPAYLLTGCGLGGGGVETTAPVTAAAAGAISGVVHGGQQPISGAQIALYAAGKGGPASPPRSMLTGGYVYSDNNGIFNITGKYTCQAGDQVYLVATGGSSGGGTNTGIAMMAAIGPCSTLFANAATTYITMNEVTTVASVFALAPFMNGPQALGSASDTPSADALAAAFAEVQNTVSVATGVAPQTSKGNGIVPRSTINSLANALAACVNSPNVGAGGCTGLFGATTVSGSTPADTLQATLNVAKNPAANPMGVFDMGGSSAPFQPALMGAPASYAITVAHPSDVLMYHDDMSRDGVQSAESTLTPANVNSTHFGKLVTYPVDSYLYAQPLYAGGIGMPDGLVHNLMIAATSRGTVYAFDADSSTPATATLWTESLVPSGERYPTGADYFGCNNPEEAGIVGTPVIDRASRTIYFVVKTISQSSATFYHRLHAISLIDGSERPSSPQVISPTFTGTGDGTTGTTIPFSGKAQNERSALLLAPNASGGNTVWIAYASHCDVKNYHGIVLGYDDASLANTAAFIDTPNGADGGIWMNSGGLAADAAGYIYALTGNGDFDVNLGGTDYGDAAVKLAPPGIGAASPLMNVSDYFVPYNQYDLDNRDLDVGGAEGILFTDSASSVAPNLMIASDKNGSVYLINRDNMSHYNPGPGNYNNDIQDFKAGGVFIYNFSFFNNILYTSNPVYAYAFTPGSMVTAGSLNPTPIASPGNFIAAPVVSVNGTDTTSTLVWMQDTSGEMHAYTAGLTELYNTRQAGSRDTPPTFVKFSSPVIANGKVYVSGYMGISVYGPM